MKKFLLLLVLTLVSVNLSAQNIKNDGKPYAFYCMMQGVNAIGGNMRVVVVWNNNEVKGFLSKDEKGEKVSFKSLVDLLNFMSKRGWEYVSQIETDGKMLNFLFRKYVTNDEEAKEGLVFEPEK